MKDRWDNIYHWMMVNLPLRVMYRYSHINRFHKMWLPRWGWSKRQLKESADQAESMMKIFDMRREADAKGYKDPVK